jgi:HAD superfamily hydrolase (TIGR01490 family)
MSFPMQKKYALFDFDGTLCKGDSIIDFCLYACKHKLSTRRQLLAGLWASVRFKTGRITIEQAKQAALSWMKGRSQMEMQDVALRFCREVLEPRFFPDGIAALQKEKREGATVLLITASPSFYLEPMKEILGVSDVIGTRMDVDPDGLYTSLVGDNCRGLQKPLRLAEYLASKGDRLDYDASAAYGNSTGDVPMLEVCSRKVAVNPGRKMRSQLAAMENVTTVRWGTRPGKAAAKEG